MEVAWVLQVGSSQYDNWIEGVFASEESAEKHYAAKYSKSGWRWRQTLDYEVKQ